MFSQTSSKCEISNLGENAIVEYIRNLPCTRIRRGDSATTSWVGSDCADLRTLAPQLSNLVMSKDLLIENVHFLTKWIPADWLAAKSLRVNLSDLAAGGATPVSCLLGLALPRNRPWSWLKVFLDRFSKECVLQNVALLGGDVTESETLVISLTVMGSSEASQAVSRAQAKTGDLLCVTGNLGDSAAGLDLIKSWVGEKSEKSRSLSPSANEIFKKFSGDQRRLVLRHYLPRNRRMAGVQLASMGVRSMMDLSDGLLGDATKMARASRCQFHFEISKIPISQALKTVCAETPQRALKYAVVGGEDYELLCAIEPSRFSRCASELLRHGCGLTVIGRVGAGRESDVDMGASVIWESELEARELDLADWRSYEGFRFQT